MISFYDKKRDYYYAREMGFRIKLADRVAEIFYFETKDGKEISITPKELKEWWGYVTRA